MATEGAGFDHLDAAGAAAGRASTAPRRMVYGTLALATLLSWLLLGAMAVSTSQRALLPHEHGPGAFLLRMLPDLALPGMVDGFIALCLTPAAGAAATPSLFGALWLMWMLMSVAMMLPSAAPMVRTYCEIADTALGRGMPAVHPLVLVGGYLSIWSLAAAGFAALGLAVQAFAVAPAAPVTGLAGAAALALAGLYQFSGLKEACLRKCRNPFAVLFANWSDRPQGVFRLGVRQGLWCLGCCWALMLVMFAVGTMNVFWMALIGLFALVEKEVSGPVAPRVAGTILLVWAVALLLVSVWSGEAAYA